MTKISTPPASVEVIAKPFKAFSWQYGKYEHYHSLQTAALDIGKGIAKILEIIEMGSLDRMSDNPAMFDMGDRADLMRMAITSASLLAEKASDEIEFENARFLKESK